MRLTPVEVEDKLSQKIETEAITKSYFTEDPSDPVRTGEDFKH